MGQLFSLTAQRLTNVLADFKIAGEVVSIQTGPSITLYEVGLAPGVKAAKIIGLANDIARCMSVQSARIATIPGKTTIGIELPNAVKEIVSLAELFLSPEWVDSKAVLPIALGKDMYGVPVIADLASMPHLLIAGTTGSGKSVGIHAMIASLLYRYNSSQLRLILIDPKMLEMTQYVSIPHLLMPLITDPNKAVVALKDTLIEMERRYRLMSKLNVRNITCFNELIESTRLAGDTIELSTQAGYDEDGNLQYKFRSVPLEPMPYIVVVIDEVADLMMVAGRDIEFTVQRLSQMARAAGIHLIMATQRPSVNIITGSIKANFPSRISYQLQSKIDSRTIIGRDGAEQLTGNGDLLLLQGAAITRIQGAYVDPNYVQELVDFHVGKQGVAYLEEISKSDAEFG